MQKSPLTPNYQPKGSPNATPVFYSSYHRSDRAALIRSTLGQNLPEIALAAVSNDDTPTTLGQDMYDINERVEQLWAEGAIRRMHEYNAMNAINEGWKE